MDTRYRSQETEIMDDFGLQGAELEKALTSIARINQLLGGNKLTIDAVDQLISTGKDKSEVRILDLGCGNGDMLRALARLAKKRNYHFTLKGIDANAYTIQNAEQLSKQYPNIGYECADFLAPDFRPEKYDIILFTLTLHHFTDTEIMALLRKCRAFTGTAIIINDLERSPVSYFLFSLISKLFRLNRINDNDGKLSILRGFKRKELIHLAQKLNFKNYTIRWKWAFRYQWIISDL